MSTIEFILFLILLTLMAIFMVVMTYIKRQTQASPQRVDPPKKSAPPKNKIKCDMCGQYFKAAEIEEVKSLNFCKTDFDEYEKRDWFEFVSIQCDPDQSEDALHLVSFLDHLHEEGLKAFLSNQYQLDMENDKITTRMSLNISENSRKRVTYLFSQSQLANEETSLNSSDFLS